MALNRRFGRAKRKGVSSDPKEWPTREKISFALKNPKLGGGSAFERYQRYKYAKTVQEALDKGACMGDLCNDFERGHLIRKPAVKHNSIAYAVSLGSRCLVAEVLRDMGLRRFSCPFDWIYSSCEMVSHCLSDNFKTLLDASQFVKSGKAFGHKYYSRMLERGIIYPHHNPKQDKADFERRVARFKAASSSSKRKLFVVCNVIESPKGWTDVQEGKGKDFHEVFAALLKKGRNFELLAVNVLCGKPSKATVRGMTKAPIVEKLAKWGRKVGQNRLTVCNFHCLGACTGLRLKNQKDSEALGRLFSDERTFDLAADPLMAAADLETPANKAGTKRSAASSSSSFEFHPTKTVKKMEDGTWRMKKMD